MQDFLFPGRANRARALVVLAIAAGGFAMRPAVADPAPRIVVAQTEKPSGQGTINAVDTISRKLKITHGPVSVLNWPGMTMDFAVASSIDLTAIKPGMKIGFTLSRDADDRYVIDQIKPAE
jgi:Cu/Ag efflux protein CusF